MYPLKSLINLLFVFILIDSPRSIILNAKPVFEPCVIPIRGVERALPTHNRNKETLAVGRLGAVVDEQSNVTRQRRFCSFYGIPYAYPPLAEFRFEPPLILPPRWIGRKVFKSEASPCLQPAGMNANEINIIGSENCLFLNIHTIAFMPPPLPTFTLPTITLFKEPLLEDPNLQYSNTSDPHAIRKFRPSIPESRQLPVLVWLHGGSYNFGSGTSDTNGTDYLVAKVQIIFIQNDLHTKLNVPTLDHNLNRKTPERMLESSKHVNAVPLIIGSTSNEVDSDFPLGFLWENVELPNKDHKLLESLDAYLQSQLKTPFEDASEHQRLDFMNSLRQFVDYYYGIWTFAANYGQRSGKRVFVYRFSFDGQFNYYKQLLDLTSSPGAVHGDDLGYIFGKVAHSDAEKDLVNEKLVRERNVQMWTNFAKFGDPTPQRTRNLLPIKWPAFNKDHKLLDINVTLSLLPYEQLIDNNAAYRLWDVIYRCLYHIQCTVLYNEYLLSNTTLIQ